MPRSTPVHSEEAQSQPRSEYFNPSASGEPVANHTNLQPHIERPDYRQHPDHPNSEPLITDKLPVPDNANQTVRHEGLRGKVLSAEEAVKLVRSGERVYIGGGCGEPVVLAEALARRSNELRAVEIVHVLTAGHAAYAEPGLEDSFHINSLFIAPNVRGAVQAGRADFTPVFLHEIPKLFRDGYLPIDVALISVSPPDDHGYCSYGVEIGVTKPAVECARTVIAEINPHMPRTWGNSFIHLSKITHCVPVDYALPERPQGSPTPLYKEIGRHVAALIEDGDTLQMGIGAIPDAVLAQLGNKRDLGVHTEMFSDGIIDLIEGGVITGNRKNFLHGKVVSSFMLGTERLYRFVHDNPIIEMRP